MQDSGITIGRGLPIDMTLFRLPLPIVNEKHRPTLSMSVLRSIQISCQLLCRDYSNANQTRPDPNSSACKHVPPSHVYKNNSKNRMQMKSLGDGRDDFCGFNYNGTSFRTIYFMDERTMTLTPCAELGMVLLQSLPMFFYSFVNFFLIAQCFPRVDSSLLKLIFVYRTAMCLLLSAITAIPLVTEMFLLSWMRLRSAYLVEFGFLSLIWITYSVVWIMSLSYKSWTRTRGLIVSQFFASKMFYLILANRWLLYGFRDERTISILIASILVSINSVGGFIEWRLKKNQQSVHHRLPEIEIDDGIVRLDEMADEGAGFLSRLFFCWTNPLILKGSKQQLNNLTDIFELPPSLQVERIEREMIENSPTFYSDGTAYSFTRALLSTFGVSYFSLGLLRLASDLFTFGGPIVLHLLVNSFESPVPNSESFLFAGLMIFFAFLAAIFSAHYSYLVQKISLRIRAAAVCTIYDKLTRIPLSEMHSFSTGRILNFVSTDVDRIVNFCNSFHAFWSLPLQLILALYLLYREVGMAFLSGLAATVVLIPINKVITNAIGKMSEKLMNCKDLRIKMIRETMEGIKVVKMSGWEDYFENKIKEYRADELKYLKARKYLDAVCVYLWASAPLLIFLSIITTYTLVLHEKLTAAKVFTALALVNILIGPLNSFPWVLNGLVEALVSIRRLEWFFGLKNMDLEDAYSLARDSDELLTVKEGNFFWTDSNTATKGVNFTGRKGQIIGITGEVGSGKSTLLLGLLAESKYLKEKISIQQEYITEGIGYLSQDRWLFRGTIFENILSGKTYDSALYEEVLKACCLRKDFKSMPGGDQYEISDNGASLSGGQRTRVALARAMYQDNSVYLFDEQFGSLDRKVADSIWVEMFEGLRNKGKLVIVATHEVRLLQRADVVIRLGKDGQMNKIGDPQTVLSPSSDEELNVEETEMSEENADTFEHVTLQDEEKEVGAVKADVYAFYSRAVGYGLSFLVIASIVFMQLSKNGADWWLSRWTQKMINDNSSNLEEWQEPQRNGYFGLDTWLAPNRPVDYLSSNETELSLRYLSIYAIIGGINTLFTLLRAFLFAYGGVVAAKNMHANLLHRLLEAPLSWWDHTPAGRVINRLCSDVYTVDDNLPFQLNIFLASLFNLFGSLVITLMGLPILTPVIIILFIVYYFIQKYYRMTSVELKRLTTLSLSPFYSLLSDTVTGLVTIRAQRFVERFSHELRLRLSANLRAQFSCLSASQYLSIRLSMIAVFVMSAITVAAIIQHRITGVDSSLIALAIAYALSNTSLLNGLLGSFVETEKEMGSVERIAEYVDEAPKERCRGNLQFPKDANGRVVFQNVSLRYGRNLPLALEGISLSIDPGQRVAILGRTGSGKSSLFQALLRMVPIERGSILIDGSDINSYSITSLRRRIGVIPQSPFIFR
ncbi:hypothetical protein WR25_12645 [Diploscapter pachys]|uniref:ABC-type xenobiotic transporter n=1 Tax=Diploscapter pachys TaxID=2018661 RepID=A0A2A2L376_9BILA|nr:hypothetical protein WR25_12645 [Diploscapter pachys]